ncbi:MAG: NnrS family protein [Gammaproteobacteria bacterium]|nr:NnrS family protein [Gammaproteobacteria bacterium]
MTPLMLSYGFRPLFLCVVATGLLFVPWWMAVFFGLVDYHGAIGPIVWHGHEMVFGFAGAAIGGFLLTAVPNWTNRPPVSGLPLALIVASWLLARLVLAVDLGLDAITLLVIDSTYWILLTTIIGREIVLGRDWRNFKIVGIPAGFIGLTVLFHAGGVFGLSDDAHAPGIAGGHYVDGTADHFDRRTNRAGFHWQLAAGEQAEWQFSRCIRSRRPCDFRLDDTGSRILDGITSPCHHRSRCTLVPASPNLRASAVGRDTARWQSRSYSCFMPAMPGWGWDFRQIGCSALIPSVAMSAGTHALGAGAMATMIMAVSSRAAMGHTGRPAHRRAGPVDELCPDSPRGTFFESEASFDIRLLTVSAALWTLAFALFAVHVGPMLLRQSRSG